jgi:hypothetical protein
MAYPYADRLKGYRQQVDFCLEQGEGPALRQLRDDISKLALTNDEAAELADIDAGVIEYLLTLDSVAPYLLDDDNAQPLDSWWWYLDEIRAKTFPADQLPEHLRVVYHANESEAI